MLAVLETQRPTPSHMDALDRPKQRLRLCDYCSAARGDWKRRTISCRSRRCNQGNTTSNSPATSYSMLTYITRMSSALAKRRLSSRHLAPNSGSIGILARSESSAWKADEATGAEPIGFHLGRERQALLVQINMSPLGSAFNGQYIPRPRMAFGHLIKGLPATALN